MQLEGDPTKETIAGGYRTSRTTQNSGLSKQVIELLKKAPPFVRYVFNIKIREPLISPIAFRIVSRRQWKFTFNERQYRYFYHPHNETWRNERAVELPIIWEEVEKHDAERVLELGNVLSHYYQVRHDIVDKHEKGDGVMNLDIVDFNTAKKYDLIISISTIEHIGFNEDKYIGKETTLQHQKPLRAIKHLKGLLAQKGRLIVTVPLGYNPTLDRSLEEDNEGIFTNRVYLKRISKSNKWVEVEEGETPDVKCGGPFSRVNVLAIYTFEHDASCHGN